MAKTFDAILKRMLDAYAADWAAMLAPWFGLPAGPLTAVESDLSIAQPAADKVFRLPADAGFLHLEVQTSWDGDLPNRVLLYNTLIHHREGGPVRSVAILLRRDANAAAITGEVSRRWPDGQEYHRFRYGVVRLWELPADQLLAGGIGTAPLGLLTDDAEGRLPELVDQFAGRVEREVPGQDERGQVLFAAYLLLGMRYDKGWLDVLFRGVQTMRESSTYQGVLEEGVEKGVEKGRVEGRAEGELLGEIKALRSTLQMTLQFRFGTVPPSLQDRIAACTDAERLRAAQAQAFAVAQPDDLILYGRIMSMDWVFLPRWMVEGVHKFEIPNAEAEGMRLGFLKGLRHSVVVVLERRFLKISPAVREKIDSAIAVNRLEVCLRRSVYADVTRPEDLLYLL